MTRFWRSRLSLRMALVCVLASLVPLIGAGLLTLHLVERSVQRDVTNRLTALGDLGAALIRDRIHGAQDKLTTVGRLLMNELGGMPTSQENRRQIAERLDRLVEPADLFLELQLYAANQTLVVLGDVQNMAVQSRNSMDPSLEVKRQLRIAGNRHEPVVTAPLATNEAFAAADVERDGEFTSLAISVPVSAQTGPGSEAAGVVVGGLDFQRVAELLTTLAQGGYRIRLLDGRGAMLGEAGQVDGDAIAVTTQVGHGDWSLEIGQSAASAHASVAELRGQALWWIGVVAALAAALGIGIALRLVRPIETLTAAARRMESGELSARTGIERGDEIGQLGRAFDRMAEALEKLDAAKSEFVANVSHELRTPLTSIQLSIANLLDGVVGPIEDRPKRTLTRLRGDVERLIDLVQALLDVARLDAGALQPRKQPVDLVALARDTASELMPLARDKEIAIDVSGDASAEVDPAMVRRVLANLIDNAIKFTPRGGSVSIRARDADGRAQIDISDTGPGLDIDDPFAKFSQGASRGVKHKGAGLGLAIAKKLIEVHGGTIEYAPGAAQGATFVITL